MMKNTVLKLLLPVLGAALAASALVSAASLRVTVDTMDGTRYYTVRQEELQGEYEDSYLFNNLFAGAAEDVLRLAAIRAQLETNGAYDADKEIDVTAYVYRDRAGLPNDYITAFYRLGDLLQWGQSGFTYETRSFDARESANFLSAETTYVHILGSASGQDEDPALTGDKDALNRAITKERANETPAAGTYRVLRNRFRTVQNENVEDLVSDWNDYAALTANIEEAAKELYASYVEYTTDFAYYNAADTNLRYVISSPSEDGDVRYANFTLPEPASGEGDDGSDEAAAGDESGITGHTHLSEVLPLVVNTSAPGDVRYLAFTKNGDVFETNTLLTKNTVRTITENYRKSFPDDSFMIMYLDTGSMTIDDSFLRAGQDFDSLKGKTSFGPLLPALFAIMYVLALLLRLTVAAGASGHEGSKRRFPLPTELLVIGSVSIVISCVYGVMRLSVINSDTYYLAPIAALLGALSSIAFTYALFDLIDRTRAKALRRESLFGKLSRKAGTSGLSARETASVLLFTLVPAAVLAAVNILLPLWFGTRALPSVIALDAIAVILIAHRNLGRERIRRGIEKISSGAFDEKINESRLYGSNLEMARGVNTLSDGIEEAIGVSLRDERLKADLITNVSHDIKTPLTSIINYVDLLKRENIEDENIREYIRVLDEKSARLKQLTVDLVEASKISSGSITVDAIDINLTELCRQITGEYHERFMARSLTVVFAPEEENFIIRTDPRHLMRIIENLLNNVCKYAMENTRVYFNLAREAGGFIALSIKNVSEAELNFDAKELTERFIRGDISRSTEGSGLGLSIAESLTRHLGGRFEIKLDGDLFKVTVAFPESETETVEI